jgi:hypothetical protein
VSIAMLCHGLTGGCCLLRLPLRDETVQREPQNEASFSLSISGRPCRHTDAEPTAVLGLPTGRQASNGTCLATDAQAAAVVRDASSVHGAPIARGRGRTNLYSANKGIT